MKYALALTCLMLTTGCITAADYDRGDAFAKCDNIKVVTSRDRCIAKAIRDSERQRQADALEQSQSDAEAEQRELDRVIAGAGNN